MIYLIPLLDAIFLGLLVYIVTRMCIKRKNLLSLLAHAIASLEEQITQKLEAADFAEDVNFLIDQRLDDLVLVFKQQIPMASMLLTGKLADKLKMQAKIEIMKMVPELKHRLMDKFSRRLDLRDAIVDKIQSLGLERRCLQIASAAALVGLLIGFVNILLFYLLRG